MSTFILVHGAWHGAWCWYRMVPLLERMGHRALAIDLPGHGTDRTPPGDITLTTYADRVCNAIDGVEGSVLLVGHSMGGGVITQAAEYRSHRIGKLIYLAAVVPRDGECLHQASGQGDGEGLKAITLPVADGAAFALPTALSRGMFYGDCPEEDVYLASLLLTPQPFRPLEEPVRISADHYGKVPKVYIECSQDNALAPSRQKQYQHAAHVDQVVTLDSSHSPFFSRPEELASLLSTL